MSEEFHRKVSGKKRSHSEQQEGDGRASKAARHNDKIMTKPSPDVFTNELLVYNIMSFLNTRELYCLTFCNKLLRSILDYTLVIRAALFQDDMHVQQAIRSVCGLVKERQIYIPSPHRLLRMVNAKHCEVAGCTRNVWYSNPRMSKFGVMFCQRHFMDASSKLIKTTTKKWWPLFDQTRTAIHWQYESGYHLWHSPFRDTAGDRAGPILTMDWIKKKKYPKRLLKEQNRADPHSNNAGSIVEALEKAEFDSQERRALYQ